MAGGWARDGAIQEQIDASVADAVELARRQLPQGESLMQCEQCDADIPRLRREAIPGVRLCVGCQAEWEKDAVKATAINRRGKQGQPVEVNRLASKHQ